MGRNRWATVTSAQGLDLKRGHRMPRVSSRLSSLFLSKLRVIAPVAKGLVKEAGSNIVPLSDWGHYNSRDLDRP